MPTIKQVARKAGVSVATVSYVLNQARPVRPETSKKVLAAARDLDYSVNTVARGLVTGRSSILGLIVPDIQNPFFPEITTAFQEAAQSSGLEAIVINTNYEQRRIQGIVNRLASLQMPGAAFFTSGVSDAVRRDLAERKICAVYLDYERCGALVSSISIDYQQGILLALDHLVQLGHRRIAFVGGPEQRRSARKRQAAFLEGAARAGGLEVRALDSDFTVEGGYAVCAQVLDAFPATALITANDLMAIGAMHCAYDRRVSVPADLSIVGFDDIMFSRFTQPSLTTVAVPRQEMGRLAFQLLSDLVAHPTRRGVRMTLETKLVVRESTAPPR
jgi:DNA-binding LacI/PurR family transcriptional regulator